MDSLIRWRFRIGDFCSYFKMKIIITRNKLLVFAILFIPIFFPLESLAIIDFPADVSLTWKCARQVDSAAFL